MKNIRFAAMMLLVLAMVCSIAMAEVTTTGNVNLRVGPGLDYELAGDISEGKTMEYLDETSVDERGVAWYLVDFKGNACWVSSKYTELNNTEPEKAKQAWVLDVDKQENYMEISGWYLQNLATAAAEIGLENYTEVPSEAPNQYSNEWLTIGGYEDVEYMALTGGEYLLYGVAIGMECEAAAGVLQAAGLDLNYAHEDCWVFEHPSGENSFVDVDGYDSCINMYIADGAVTEMDWSTYTG